ncbi:MAG TPA: pantoate--beta-alanine ligase [Cytophagales bacterium]|nr:pantoate--beta-alanine ligase [Cytophagales bacterium]
MFVFNQISQLQEHLRPLRASKRVAFVPTMGALHEGHLHLVKEAKKDADLVVVSIFVNPLQFNNPVDLEKYPHTLDQDTQYLQSVGCDVLFVPNAQEMYPHKPSMQFNFGSLELVMEGKFRPGHFNGVAIVVSKLFHMVQPHMAYFGQKDFQQCAVIKTLIADLSFPIQMVTVPTVRTSSGLAMSSRNQRLSPEGLEKAAQIYAGLQKAKNTLVQHGTLSEASEKVVETVTAAGIHVEYVEIVDALTLLPPTVDTMQLVICFAGFLEEVRLIDNIIVERSS